MKNQEAMRCLLCRNARCTAACPVGTDVPACQKLYREDRLEEAGRILFENNPLSAVTSRICEWKKFCYGACVLNAKKAPIRWHEIEEEISTAWLHSCHPMLPSPLGLRVAIVGAGPVGIAAGIWLGEAGYDVTIFDDHEEIGGVLRYGIPPFRLDRSLCSEYARVLEELGVRFEGNIHIGTERSISQLRDDYDAVLIGCGAASQNALNIPGERMPHVHYAIDYLEAPESVQLRNPVIVIGGGNVAMDACRTAVRQGLHTSVYYRKTFENMPANPDEVEAARQDGVSFHVFETPVEVRGHSVIFCTCENYTDISGRVMTHVLEGTEHEVECGSLLIAAGETVDLSVFGVDLPELDGHHLPAVSAGNETSIPGVFVAGDFLLGARTVVEAVASARIAVRGIRASLERGTENESAGEKQTGD